MVLSAGGSSSMRFPCLVSILLVSVVCAQTKPTATLFAGDATAQRSASEARGSTSEVAVGPGDPVITINNFCTDPGSQGTACKTVITRAQFEKLTDALQPGMSLSLRLNVANAYARNMRMSAVAERRGLDKTPEFEEEMNYARMQLLSQDLNRTLQADANNVSHADIEAYYQEHKSSFEQATVARIFIPPARQFATSQEVQNPRSSDAESAGNKASATEPSESQRQAAEAARGKLAADLRARAVAGEDPDKLQVEAYQAAGIMQSATNTKMEKVQRATLPPQHESVMDLQPGEVSKLFSDPQGAEFIYKMISKGTLTLEDAKPEIRTQISSQRYRESMKNFEGDVVFNDAYFMAPGKPATPPQTRRVKRNGRPAVQSDTEQK
jgi:hypothetical protein